MTEKIVASFWILEAQLTPQGGSHVENLHNNNVKIKEISHKNLGYQNQEMPLDKIYIPIVPLEYASCSGKSI